MATNTTKILTSAVAAVTVATGVYIGVESYSSDSEDFKIDWSEYIPDISSYIPALPTVEIPDVSVDVDSITKIDMNSILNGTSKETVSKEELDKLISVTIPVIEKYDFNKNILQNIERMQKLQKYFRDQRSINYDEKTLDNVNVDKWISIYENYKDVSYEKIKLKKQYRMISEILLPKSKQEMEILKTNLDYYKGRGYDSVLIVFDGTEKPDDLKNLSKYVRYQSFEYFFAFSGNENLRITIFVDPELLKDQLQALSEYGSGMLTGWRRTSAHLLLQDDAYMNYFVKCVREKNPSIPIIGEAYYGNTAEYHEAGNWGFGINMPKCSSTCMIVNFGFSSTDIKSIVKKLIPAKVGNYDLIGVVVGQNPYYLTEYPNKLGQMKNQEIKEKIESKFLKAGCKGTITLHDDGKHGFDKKPNNNLSNTVYTELK